MATTVDDLIALKDQAVAACAAVVASWEHGDLAAAARFCEAVCLDSDDYDAADADDSVADLAAWKERAAR